MFSNRLCLIYAAAISFLLVPSCSKQTEDEGGGGSGNGNAPSIFAKGGNNGSGDVGNTNTDALPGQDSIVENPDLVGQSVPISQDEYESIKTSGCNAWAIEPESSPAKLQLIVDISSSMNEAAPGNAGMSKWDVTKAALTEAICGVQGTGLANNTNVGLMFYPYKLNDTNTPTSPVDMNQCIDTNGTTIMAELGQGDGSHRELIRQAFTSVTLGRGTPTADAYDYALNQIALSEAQLNIVGETYLLLITDGRPTFLHGCYNPSGQIQDLPGDEVVVLVRDAWTQHMVKTFIVGCPGSEGGRDWLSQAASDGQTGQPGCSPGNPNGPYCHMDMTTAPDFSQALTNGLNQVVAAVSGCKFEVPAESADGRFTVDPNKISPLVRYGDGSMELIYRHNNQNVACDQGFELLENGSQVKLCDGTCNKFTNDSRATMQLIFGCAPNDIESQIL